MFRKDNTYYKNNTGLHTNPSDQNYFMWKISFSKIIHKAVMNIFVHQIANGWIHFAIWMWIELEGRAQKWMRWTCSSLYNSVDGIKQHAKKKLLVNFPNWIFNIIGIKINGINFSEDPVF